jgi:hypothetical protein
MTYNSAIRVWLVTHKQIIQPTLALVSLPPQTPNHRTYFPLRSAPTTSPPPPKTGTNAARIVGTSADLARDRQSGSQPTRFSKILGRLYPVMLRLAAGHDPVGRQLFGPLITSLVHWLTRWVGWLVG